MNIFTLTSIIITLAVMIGYINHRYFKLQNTIAVMVGSMLISLVLIFLQYTHLANVAVEIEQLMMQIDLHHLLIDGMLSFLLFAGALSIDFNSLKKLKWEIGILATVSTAISALIIGTLTYYLLIFLNIHLPYLYCFLFGALISPTDPIAVLATFKQIRAPKHLTACVAGESLFNDGIGIVIFITFYQLTFNHQPMSWQGAGLLFIQQAIGGILYGFILGLVTHYLIKYSRDATNAILITLAAVTGGYTLAAALNISGAIAMVVAGILVGNKVRDGRRAEHTRKVLDIFWEVIDELLNATLFLLIGFELLIIHVSWQEALVAILMIPLVLLVRLCTVAVPMKLLQFKRRHDPYMITMLTWGGLRGGLAVALALSLPANHYRDLILAMTYSVVAFAVIVQGLTIKPLAQLAKNKK